MSFHRENVTWQSENLTWNLGFFEVLWVGEDDPEWDVEYGSGFEDVYVGYPTREAAWEAFRGPNPGGTSTWAWGEANREQIEAWDAEAARVKAARKADGVWW